MKIKTENQYYRYIATRYLKVKFSLDKYYLSTKMMNAGYQCYRANFHIDLREFCIKLNLCPVFDKNTFHKYIDANSVPAKIKEKKFIKRSFSGKDFYNSPEWRSVRYLALKRDGRRCACCGATPDDGLMMHVDHIKPRSKYPELELALSNLQILCADCNLGKSNTDEIDWRPRVIEDISKYH